LLVDKTSSYTHVINYYSMKYDNFLSNKFSNILHKNSNKVKILLKLLKLKIIKLKPLITKPKN